MGKMIFLGGTCNDSTWRESLIAKLSDHLTYFNPVVKNWAPECQEEELRQRETCDWCLYVITPRMTGFYSIAEAADDSNKRPEQTIFAYVQQEGDLEFTPHQLKSLEATGKLIENNGGLFFRSLSEVANYFNRL